MQRFDRLEAEPYSVDGLALIDNRLYIDGWVFPEIGTSINERLQVNNARPDLVVAVERPDVAALFTRRKNARACGFHLEHSVDPTTSMLELHCTSRFDDPRNCKRNSVYIPLKGPAVERAVPTPEQRFRVIANRDLDGFLRIGCTDAQRLLALMRLDFPDLSQLRALDWGVGCGRLARHTCDAFGSLTGVDIDADNVNWCTTHLPGRYEPIILRDPTAFASGSFDIVYGVSVFTHLREDLQDLWLKELRRLLRPGGRAYVTVHGRTTIEYSCRPEAQIESDLYRLQREGIFVSGPNSQLDGFVPEPAEYLNVFHHRDYVLQHWQPYFKSIEIIPGYIYTHDLVVLER